MNANLESYRLKDEEINSLKTSLQSLEEQLNETSFSKSNVPMVPEELYLQKQQEFEKQTHGLNEKCKLFEKKLETSEESRRNESKESTDVKKDLERKVQELESERKRLQEEAEKMEQAALLAATPRKVIRIQYYFFIFFHYFNTLLFYFKQTNQHREMNMQFIKILGI